MNRLIIVGSPRVSGRCAHVADALFEACIDEFPEDEVALAPVSTLQIAGCVGCDACKRKAAQAGLAGEPEGEGADAGDELASRCVIDDDMTDIYPLIDAADELTVVAPVYFAGPSSQMKALLDRLQPYFWTDARQGPRRPAVLHVVGEGGDPHGFEPLVGTVRSALGVAGFHLERVLDWVGKVSEDGEILAEAEVTEYPQGAAPSAAAGDVDAVAVAAPIAGGAGDAAPVAGGAQGAQAGQRQRKKLTIPGEQGGKAPKGKKTQAKKAGKGKKAARNA